MSLVALETAQVAALKADAEYVGKIKGTYSGKRPESSVTPLPDSVFPYVVFGTLSAGESDFSSHDVSGEDSDVTVHIWSRYPGKKEVYEIYAIFTRLFHRKRLTIPGAFHVRQMVRLVSVFLDPDGKTIHGVIRIKSSTQ